MRSFFGILPLRVRYADVSAPPETLPLPYKVTLLGLSRTPSDLTLRVGDEVKTGQNLAPVGGSPFVSTATGVVEEIGTLKGADGHQYVSVFVKPNPVDLFDPSLITIDDFTKARPVELRMAIIRAGFSDLSAISFDAEAWPKVETLILSALDLDPLGVANQQAFRDQADRVYEAMQLLTMATEPSRCVLAVPNNLADVATNISLGSETLVLVPAVYPNGLKEILARKYGAGLLLKSKDGGVVGNTLVISVEEAISMVSSLKTGKPHLEKTITLTNGNNGAPRNFKIRIGTPIRHLLETAGVTLQSKGKLIVNGIMGGYACFSDEQPITSETAAIHVQAPGEVSLFQDAACMNCGKCNAICPVDLEVNLLGRYSQYGIYDKCKHLGAENCIACGLCAYVCPARRPLVHLISHAKQMIETEVLESGTRGEALPCDTCEATCPTIRLFEPASKEQRPSIRDS